MITLTVNDAEVTRALAELRTKTGNLKPALAEIGTAMVESTRLRFRDSKGPDGQPWAPLSPLTVLLRTNKSNKPLEDTGVLRNSITSRLEGDNAVLIGPKRQSSNVRYPAVHQFGAFIRPKRGKSLAIPLPDGKVALLKSVRIPKRPFLGLSEEDKTTILGLMARHLEV